MSRTQKSTPRQVGTALLQDLRDKLAVQAQKAFGVSASAATAFAIDAAVSVADDWGGQLIYIPMDAAGRLSQRNSQIWRDFHGDNHQELATKYGLSVIHIYRVFHGDNHQELATKYGLSVIHIYRVLDEQRRLHTPRQASLLDKPAG